MSARTVVLIHGRFMTPLCWEKWTPVCQERGLKVLVPAWPLQDRSVAEQRQRHPSAELAALSLGQVLAQLRGLVAGLPEPPILIGHSMGGLLVQLLFNWRLYDCGYGTNLWTLAIYIIFFLRLLIVQLLRLAHHDKQTKLEQEKKDEKRQALSNEYQEAEPFISTEPRKYHEAVTQIANKPARRSDL